MSPFQLSVHAKLWQINTKAEGCFQWISVQLDWACHSGEELVSRARPFTQSLAPRLEKNKDMKDIDDVASALLHL